MKFGTPVRFFEGIRAERSHSHVAEPQMNLITPGNVQTPHKRVIRCWRLQVTFQYEWRGFVNESPYSALGLLLTGASNPQKCRFSCCVFQSKPIPQRGLKKTQAQMTQTGDVKIMVFLLVCQRASSNKTAPHTAFSLRPHWPVGAVHGSGHRPHARGPKSKPRRPAKPCGCSDRSGFEE